MLFPSCLNPPQLSVTVARIGQMVTARPRRTAHRTPRPLDRTRLEELALAYVARFATTREKLRRYLSRKLRERGWDGEGEPPVDSLAERLADAGYVDDRAYAVARCGGLLRRGYGARRISQDLTAAGIAGDLRDELRAPEAELRAAALALARRRGFGPFGKALPERPVREKQLAAMLRAGHAMTMARAVIDAPDVEAADLWASEE